ncbi:hypothetical protein D3C80_1402660 [compost metagenome]
MVEVCLIFPLTVAGQLVTDLCFATQTKTHIRLVAIGTFIIGKIVKTIDFTEQIQFITVFVVDFRRACCACNQQCGYYQGEYSKFHRYYPH